jgi:hypothetical protein
MRTKLADCDTYHQFPWLAPTHPKAVHFPSCRSQLTGDLDLTSMKQEAGKSKRQLVTGRRGLQLNLTADCIDVEAERSVLARSEG